MTARERLEALRDGIRAEIPDGTGVLNNRAGDAVRREARRLEGYAQELDGILAELPTAPAVDRLRVLDAAWGKRFDELWPKQGAVNFKHRANTADAVAQCRNELRAALEELEGQPPLAAAPVITMRPGDVVDIGGCWFMLETGHRVSLRMVGPTEQEQENRARLAEHRRSRAWRPTVQGAT